MKFKKLKLGAPTAKTLHASIVKAKNAYSLTFNITKLLSNDHRNKTYKDALRDIKHLFMMIGPYIINCMISAEYNKNEQIHFHTYLTTRDDISSSKFTDVIKYHMPAYRKTLWQDHGNGWKLKLIDEISDELVGYPFKDITRSEQLSKECFSPFEIHHYYLESEGNLIIESKAPSHKTIIKIKDFLKII